MHDDAKSLGPWNKAEEILTHALLNKNQRCNTLRQPVLYDTSPSQFCLAEAYLFVLQYRDLQDKFPYTIMESCHSQSAADRPDPQSLQCLVLT